MSISENGGVDKIITTNPAFKHIMPQKKVVDNAQNVFRALFRDSNGYLWVATKAGKIYVISPEKQVPAKFNTSSF